MIFGAGLYILRERVRTDRERVWAGMARESAHQLGTPLSSLSGWIELLEESELVPAPRLTELKQEAHELVAITVASIKTARKNHPR